MTEPRGEYGAIPDYSRNHGLTAWELHLRALAKRAVRLQDEHHARLDERDNERENTRYTGKSERIVSPLQSLIDEARAARRPKKGILASLMSWW